MVKFCDIFLMHWLRKIKIGYRIFMSFVLISLLPLIISGAISYAQSSQAIMERTRNFSSEIVKQVAKNIEFQFQYGIK